MQKCIQRIPKGAGGASDPYEMLWQLMKVHDPVPVERESTTPLFRALGRAGPGGHTTFSTDDITHIIQRIAGAAGFDPGMFTSHSLRIGGATDYRAQGATQQDLERIGRWESDIAHIYTTEGMWTKAWHSY